MDALEALADPTRRRVVELLSAGELTAGEIAAEFEQSRPAVSRQLRLLREAGVVDVRAEGTRRVYVLRRDPLADAELWLRQRLDALDTELRRGRHDR
ncbi:MAG: metalloregulator ArsR/SmtB family transcription factor [Pseudonocardiales bacterium]